jgi:hypothetical protein
MQSCKFSLAASELIRLQEKFVEVLDLSKANLPEKNGVKTAGEFEKGHSILHKVRKIILLGWSEAFSAQGPEHCQIDLVKRFYTAQTIRTCSN